MLSKYELIKMSIKSVNVEMSESRIMDALRGQDLSIDVIEGKVKEAAESLKDKGRDYGYDKCWMFVTFANGDTHKVRMDITYDEDSLIEYLYYYIK